MTTMGTYYGIVTVRPFREGEEKHVCQLVRRSIIDRLPAACVRALSRDITFQAGLVLSLALTVANFQWGNSILVAVGALIFFAILYTVIAYLYFALEAHLKQATEGDLYNIAAHYSDKGAGAGSVMLVAQAMDLNRTYDVVGCVALERQSAVEVQLKRLAVGRSCTRKGVGKKLVAHALARAKSAGFQRITVHVQNYQYPAMRLFTSMGFEQIHKSDKAFGLGSAYLSLTLVDVQQLD